MAPPRVLEDAADRKTKRARYFRRYYEAHKETILAKNRRWMEEHKARVAQLRRARRHPEMRPTRTCLDCGFPTVRALRCRACHARFRYWNDPAYRERRLETTRRWLAKQPKG